MRLLVHFSVVSLGDELGVLVVVLNQPAVVAGHRGGREVSLGLGGAEQNCGTLLLRGLRVSLWGREWRSSRR